MNDFCVRFEGGGPAGVVDGWFLLARCESGVEGGVESGTLNIVTVQCSRPGGHYHGRREHNYAQTLVNFGKVWPGACS